MPDQYYSYAEAEDQDGSFYYIFTTSDKSGYTVYFKMDEYTDYVNDFPLLLQKGFAFGFHKKEFVADSKKSKDPMVFETIYKIALDFLEQQGIETVLLYHCDANDGKQACRNRLFENWAKVSHERKNFIKHSIEIVIGDDTAEKKDMYLGFLTLLENPLIDEVRNEFEEFSIYLITPKE
ncbi:hypothetical protein A0256_11360 [Mucilaginibacter sp. PAMC 26640]|nr:hypothetical protein A0256_11360 [Mucilaginibacter sp. PAMC 26640]